MIVLESIKDQGSLDRERAVFRVTASGDIGSQIVMRARSTTTDGKRKLHNAIYDTYWFIDKQVSEGDLVVLYTKSSTSSYKVKLDDASGVKTHFFYWKKEAAIWSRAQVALVTGKLSGWKTTHVDANDRDVEPAD